MKRLLFMFLLSFAVVQTRRHCRSVRKSLKYFKIKSCYRSTLPLSFLTDVNRLEECMTFARRKNGFAFNFSPREAQQYTRGTIVNCQVLSCTEMNNSSSLVADEAFDYYSAYGNVASNATCVKNIGVFTVISEKHNYTNAISNCQKIGADLADVSSEMRTKYLSKTINSSLQEWYRVAYVGLDDIEQEGSFSTVFGVPLTCSIFRAWGPGHPISSREDEDCVVVDSERMWRVVDCGRKLPSVCEIYPGQPENMVDVNCAKIGDKKKKKKCELQHSLNELFKNSSRREKCAIMNYEDNSSPHN